MAHLGVVVANPGSLTAGDEGLTTLFVGAGHTTAYVDDNAAVPGGFALFVLSESCSPFSLLEKYRDIAVPVICLETGSYIEMGLASTDGVNTGISSHTFDLQAHDITAGLPDPCQVRTNAASQWGVPNGDLPSGAVKFAGAGPSFTLNAMGWAVDTGGVIHTGTAAARRVALGYIDSWPPNLTTDGQQLLLNAAAWAVGAGGPTPVEGSATLAATSGMSAAGRSPARGTAILAGTTSLTAVGRSPARGATTLLSSTLLQTAGRSPARGRAVLAAASLLGATGQTPQQVDPRDLTLTIGPPGFDWVGVLDPFLWAGALSPYEWVAIADPFAWEAAALEAFGWDAVADPFVWVAAAPEQFVWAAGPPFFD